MIITKESLIIHYRKVLYDKTKSRLERDQARRRLLKLLEEIEDLKKLKGGIDKNGKYR